LKKKISYQHIPDSSVVMVGAGPIFWLENPLITVDEKMENEFRQDFAHSLVLNNVYYCYGLQKEQLQKLRNFGFKIYYVDSVKEYLESFVGYDLTTEGVEELKIR
jgi:hypothetical protein